MKRGIESLKGIGPARCESLQAQGITTMEDLFYYFPRRYIDRTVTATTLLQSGHYVTLEVTVNNKFLAHGRKTRLVVNCTTVSGESLSLVFFNSAKYFLGVFENAQRMLVSGKIEFYKGMQMLHPDYEFLDDEGGDLLHSGRIVPVYSTTEDMKKKGLDSRGIRRIVHRAFGLSDIDISETLSETLLKKYSYPDRKFALHTMHFPEDMDVLENAKNRLKYEELYLFNSLMRKKREERTRYQRELWPLPYAEPESFDTFIKGLPFSLTGEQENAISYINKECQKNYPQAFLLQGDVGSGKTIVALAIAYHYISNRIQAALMAPTEVLARQHFQTITSFLGLASMFRVELLTGGDKKKKREDVIFGCQTGDVDLVIGTHALIDDSVSFKDLGFVIIDEQHRFGVEQRELLRAKGKNPDILAMTATPIPRSLCLTEFADLQMVTLKEKPAGRKPVKTLMFTESRRNGVYKSIRKYVSQGQQCFIVYPMIDESEKIDLRAATDAFKELSGIIFPEFHLELLHGRLKPSEKERIMREFKEGSIHILVTTTVIEVGVDIPNATVMLIEHAERFGISQLHQLRGRVGRGREESFCILMAPENPNDEAKERLEALVKSEDGFYLSEVDMKIRGPGELLGKRQHGIDNFRLSDLVQDQELARIAYADASEIIPELPAAIDFIENRFNDGSVVFAG